MGYTSKVRTRKEELLKAREKIPAIEIEGETCAEPDKPKYHLKRDGKTLHVVWGKEEKKVTGENKNE